MAWCLPIGLLMGWWLGWMNGAMTAIAVIVGGLWLSPDLDVRSTALRRWGVLGGIWWPYRRLLRHRSLLSHGPLIGMALRLAWLSALLLLIWTTAAWLSAAVIPSPSQTLPGLVTTLKQHPKPLISVLVGLEGSVWLHLILDGDPLPAECSNRWRRKRRR
jgi:uncharacterized metal-binding protein